MSEQTKCEKKMTGKNGSPAVQEIHIFLAPLNPDPNTIEKYYAACEKFNATILPELKKTYERDDTKLPLMKPCLLSLLFRDLSPGASANATKEIRVMQSARYVWSNSPAFVKTMSKVDADFFEGEGFTCVRQKIEASAYGIDGIPLTKAEFEQAEWDKEKQYFEFHVKVELKPESGAKSEAPSPDMTPEELSHLQRISLELSNQFKVPVPLSFNNNRDQHRSAQDGLGSQRFLNVRFRGVGVKECEPRLEAVKTAVNTQTAFRVIKTISEFVWFDTAPEIDHGWIDFSPDELKQIGL